MGKRFSKILKGQITSSVFYVLFGLCLILMPVKTVDVICKVVFGLVLIGAGCYHVYIYVREKEGSTILDLLSGVIVLVLGGFLFYNPQVVVKLLPLLLGAFVLVDSIWTLQGCLKLKKYERQEWKALLLGSLIFIVLGIVMVINPFPGVKYTVIFAGWVLLLNGAADLVFLMLLNKNTKEIEEAGESSADSTKVSAKDAESSKEEEKSEADAGEKPEEWHDAWTVQNKIEEADDGPIWKKFLNRKKKEKKQPDSGQESGETSAVDGGWHSVNGNADVDTDEKTDEKADAKADSIGRVTEVSGETAQENMDLKQNDVLEQYVASIQNEEGFIKDGASPKGNAAQKDNASSEADAFGQEPSGGDTSDQEILEEWKD